jgi:hypothetical protein
MRTVMSDAFAFRSLPVPLRSRVNVRVVKAIVVVFALVAAVSAFARWTIRSEQQSLAAAAHHLIAPSTGVGSGSADLGLPASGIVAMSVADTQAQAVLSHTLMTAQRLVTHGGSPTAAGPGQLARGSKGVIFTDGPSIAPTILSVASTPATWGAAVMSESGTCFAVRLDAHGAARDGILTSGCTGANALQVTAVSR